MKMKNRTKSLNRICFFFVDKHRKSNERVSYYYIDDYFKDADLQSLRKRINMYFDDVHAINIIDCNALVLHNINKVTD